MEKTNINYYYKNLPIPDRHQYKLILLRKIESLKRNMRWNAYFFLNSIKNSYKERQEKYGFKTRKHPPHIKEIDRFKSDLIGLVKTIKF